MQEACCVCLEECEEEAVGQAMAPRPKGPTAAPVSEATCAVDKGEAKALAPAKAGVSEPKAESSKARAPAPPHAAKSEGSKAKVAAVLCQGRNRRRQR